MLIKIFGFKQREVSSLGSHIMSRFVMCTGNLSR